MDELDLESIIKELEAELDEDSHEEEADEVEEELDDEEAEQVSDIASDEIESHEDEHPLKVKYLKKVKNIAEEGEDDMDEEIDLDEILREMGYGDKDVSEEVSGRRRKG